ncbi:MAG TPA: AI-2E family transporter [Xanthobacteraceae bacterium]|nr:AI-2E family transporter [Xanthobacteraceae bacterium]
MAAHLKSAAKRGSDAKPADVRKPLPLHAGARLTARVALAIALVAAALWTAADFLPALIWSVILAVALWPLYERFARALSGGPSTLASLLFTTLTGLVLIFPIALATWQIAQQSDALFAWIKQSQDNGIPVPDWIARLPVAADALQQWWRSNLADPQAAAGWLQSINADKAAEFLRTFGGQLLNRAFMFFVSLLALFVLLRNGRSIARSTLATADRIFGDPGEGLAGKMTEAIRGTVNGTVVVAVAEGVVIGLGYAIAGVPNPLLFAVLTAAFAMLPFGAWAAFTAAALTLGLGGGEPWAAFAVFAWGALVMLAGDNFVWPTLVGGAARLPFLFAFVGIFGGLTAFGLLGLFLGPVIMAALLTVWREWVMPREGETDGG